MVFQRRFKMEFSKRKVFFLLIGISGVIFIILANFVGFYTTDRVYVVSTNFHNSSLSYLASINMSISLLSKKSMHKQKYDDIHQPTLNNTVGVNGDARNKKIIGDKYSSDYSLQSTSSINGDKEILVNASNLKQMFASFNDLDDTEQHHEHEHATDINDRSDDLEFEPDSDNYYSDDDLTTNTILDNKLNKKVEVNKKRENRNVIKDEQVNVINDVQGNVINDEQVNVIKDEQVNVIKDEQVQVIKDEQINVIKDEQINVIKDEQVNVIKDEQVNVIKDEQVNVIKDEQVNVIKDEQVNVIKDEQVNVIKDEQDNVIKDEQDKHKVVSDPVNVANLLIKSKPHHVEQQQQWQQQQQQQQQQQWQQQRQHQVQPVQNYQDNNLKTHENERISPLDLIEKSARQKQLQRTNENEGVVNVYNNIDRNRKHDDVFRKFDDQKLDTDLGTIKNVKQSSNDVEMVVDNLKDLRSHVIALGSKDLRTADATSENEGELEGFVKDQNCPSRPSIAEDILCLKRPKFLPDYRNPCWYERSRLRCLPYFYIFGVCKTGSTDLFERLSHHPEVLKNHGLLGKETWYWGWKRYGHSNFYRSYRDVMTFDEFIDNFDAYNIRSVTKRLTNRTLYHPAVTGHGDPMDFWDHSSWQMIPQNNPYWNEPNITTPSLVKHVNPNIKLILLLRDPVERLFSNYLHGRFGETAEQFHEDVLTSLTLLSSCRQTRSMKSCLYDSQIIRDLRVPISASFYSVHLEEWLKVFPRKQIFIIRTEDFSNNVANTLLRLFRFLKLDPIPTRDLYRIANMPHFYDTKAKLTAGEIHSDTREILRTLFEPYNTDLAKMLDDEKFNFNTS